MISASSATNAVRPAPCFSRESLLEEPSSHSLLRDAYLRSPRCRLRQHREEWRGAVQLRIGAKAKKLCRFVQLVCTRIPSAIFAGGLRMTRSPGLSPIRPSTLTPLSASSYSLRSSTLPLETTAALSPSLLKITACEGMSTTGFERRT